MGWNMDSYSLHANVAIYGGKQEQHLTNPAKIVVYVLII